MGTWEFFVSGKIKKILLLLMRVGVAHFRHVWYDKCYFTHVTEVGYKLLLVCTNEYCRRIECEYTETSVPPSQIDYQL